MADQVSVGATPSHLAVGQGAVWVTNADAHSVSRIDPTTHTVGQTIQVGNGPTGSWSRAGAVWVVNGLDGTVSRIDPGTNTEVQRSMSETAPSESSTQKARSGSRIRATARSRRSMPTAASPRGRCRSPRPSSPSAPERCGRPRERPAGWRASIRRAGSIVQTIHVGNGPAGIAFGRGAAWVANSLDGTVSRIDPDDELGRSGHSDRERPTCGGRRVRRRLGEQPVRRHARAESIRGRTRWPRRLDVGNRPQGIAISNGDGRWSQFGSRAQAIAAAR